MAWKDIEVSRNSRRSTDCTTSVYRYYDRSGVLIYVGITSRGILRNVEHNTTKRWWNYVHRQEVDHYPDRRSAQGAERELIRRFRPPFNIQQNPDHADLQQIYEAYAIGDGRHQPVTALLASLRRQLPLTFIEWDGRAALFGTHGRFRPIAQLVEPEERRFKVSLKHGRAVVFKEEQEIFCTLRGDRADSIAGIRVRIGYASQKPLTLRADAVSVPSPRPKAAID